MKANSDQKYPFKVGILGHVGKKNLGDEAIIDAVIENLRRRVPDAQIFGFTIDPQDTSERHGIPAFPIRRIVKNKINEISTNSMPINGIKSADRKFGTLQHVKRWIKSFPNLHRFLTRVLNGFAIICGIPNEILFLFDCYNNLNGVKLLIIAGSQQLIDYVGGPWAFPYTLFKWSIIARLANAKVVVLSVGSGPIYSHLGKYFIKKTLSIAIYRTYRDETSREWIQQLRPGDDISICPDLAFSSFKFLPAGIDERLKSKVRVVGINPVPFSDNKYWTGAGHSEYESYTKTLAFFGLWLIERGYKVHLFPTQLNLDPKVIDDIKQVMEQNSSIELAEHFVDKPVRSLDELISAISAMELVVATRYHGTVLAYALNKPVLGIAYQAKTADLMRRIEQQEYILDIHDLKLEQMKKRFISLESSGDESVEAIKRNLSAWRKTLDGQYEQVLNLFK